jgi:hypothetical protein
MVSLAIAFGPIAREFVISTANAQGMDLQDHRMLENGLNRIAGAIIGACKR